MKIIKPYYEIWEQGNTLDDVYKQIERVGRVCYKSEDKITETSAKPFVDRMISSKHYAMLEHGTIYLHSTEQVLKKYYDNKYSVVRYFSKNHVDEKHRGDDGWYVTTNLRVLVENNWLDDLKYFCEPTKYHEKRHTIHFVCDRGVSHEFVRHRVFSFAQESTRYCNYSKDKFGNEITYIIPCWCKNITHESANGWDNMLRNSEPCNLLEKIFLQNLQSSEETYNLLIEQGWKAQEARAVLPNALKTELCMTGIESDWKHFFDLRAYGVTGKPHPQASELAVPLLNEFIEKGYLHHERQGTN